MKRSTKATERRQPKRVRGDEGKNPSKKDLTPRENREEFYENDVILLKIFEFLSPQDLKSCREVNRKWNFAATSTILKMNICTLRLDFTDGKEAYRTKLRGVKNPYQEIQEVLDKSRKFPTSDWILHSPHLLMHELCPNHGWLLKSLTFLNVTALHHFQRIMDLVPNLEKLTIGKISLDEAFASSWKKLDSDSAGLKNLRILRVAKISDKLENRLFLRELLQSCPNLCEVHVLDSRLVKLVYEEGKLRLMRKAFIKFCDYSGRTLASIAKDPARFEELTIDCGRIEDDKIGSLDQILAKNQLSLKRLKVFPSVFFANIAPKHQFQNLEFLIFQGNPPPPHIHVEGTAQVFVVLPVFLPNGQLPPALPMWFPHLLEVVEMVDAFHVEVNTPPLMTQEMAPNLEKLRFEARVDLKTLSTFESVKTVEVCCVWWHFPSLERKFPNLKVLSLKSTRIAILKINKIQFWKRLPKGLQFLDLYQDTFNFIHDDLCFDAIFTGATIPKHFPNGDGRLGLVVSRGSSSILCMPSLKCVRIILDDERTVNSESFLKRFQLSTHAYLYAFQFLPRTQLVIAYDRNAKVGVSKEMDAEFKAKVPFARFEHHKWGEEFTCSGLCYVEF